jgi:microcin C transport system permease protein
MSLSLSKFFNPITCKRLRKFKQIKRAYWSFLILAVLYILSLGSELLCNDTPILVKYNDRYYFPILKYYPDDVFTDSGQQTRPNYKKIAESPQFTAIHNNFMLFPPIPYSPYEIIDPASLETVNQVEVEFIRQPRVATVNIRPDFTIEAAIKADHFFKNEPTIELLSLIDFWSVDHMFKSAVQQRFDNRAADAFVMSSVNLKDNAQRIELSLSTYKPRLNPPMTVRCTMREPFIISEKSIMMIYDKNMDMIQFEPEFWDSLLPVDRMKINKSASRRFNQPVDSITIINGGDEYKVTFFKHDIRWPYRPVTAHWLGIDNAGRDVLARIVYGFRISMNFGFILVILSIGLGIVVGAVQGYYGGLIDITSQRLIEIWSALPFLYIMILMGSIYGRSFWLLLILYGIFNWIGISYYMRGEFLRLRKAAYVESARCLGIPDHKIILKHILPNALVPIITFFPFSLVGAIGSLAALDYLGFGLPPPTASWGELLAQAQQVRWAWWLILYPALALFSVMLLGVFIGEGVREAFDPRQQSRWE